MIIPKDRKTMLPIGFTRKNEHTVCRNGFDSTFSNPEPFGNCQTFAMAYVNSLLAKHTKYLNTSTVVNYRPIAEEFIKFHVCANNKQQVIIDIHNTISNEDTINTIFGEHVVFKQPYRSTNGSSMCIYLLRIKGALDYVDKLIQLETENKQKEIERIISETGIIPEFKLPKYWFITPDTREEWDILNAHYKVNQSGWCKGFTYIGENDSCFNKIVGSKSDYNIKGFTEITFSEWELYVKTPKTELVDSPF
jgi:hypothetical protein